MLDIVKKEILREKLNLFEEHHKSMLSGPIILKRKLIIILEVNTTKEKGKYKTRQS